MNWGKPSSYLPTVKTIFVRKKEKKILVKNTSAHLKEEVGTIISITSEDNQV